MSGPLLPMLRHRLQALAHPEVRASYERYFKGVTRFHGVRSPALKQLFKTLWPELAVRTVEANVQDALALLERPFMEERQFGVMMLGKLRRGFPDDLLARLEPVFDRAVHDWATCDGICGQVLRPLLLRSERDRRRLASWSRSKNLWRQRAAAVAFVNEARHGAHDDLILKICARIVQNPERFVQLGAGWVLRELALHDRARVVAFLRDHYLEISREGLRYAIEKLPPKLQKQLLAEHRPG